MLVHYNSITGDVLGFASIGGSVPDEIPDGEAYVYWDGVAPNPIRNFTVVGGQVIQKASTVIQSQEDEATAFNVRAARDKLLDKSDYVILPDAPYSDDTKASYRTFRQQLRDLPSQAGFPNNVTWPAKPT